MGGGGGGGRGGGSVVRGRKMFNDFSHIFPCFFLIKLKIINVDQTFKVKSTIYM